MPHQNSAGKARDRASLLDSLRENQGNKRVGIGGGRVAEVRKAPAFDFSHHPAYEEVRIARAAAETLSLASPYFRVSSEVRSTEVKIADRWVTNFASYDYLSLNLSDAVRDAVTSAVRTAGVSATASRLVGGEREEHVTLERRIAEFIGTQSALAMVSGHATNMAVIRTLLGSRDLVLIDSLAHNSIYEGVLASGAARVSFPHNDATWVEEHLATHRASFDNVLIVTEGLYSMDGDTPDLARFVDIKRRNGAWLMIDEAHSIGVLGKTGRGICEEQGVDPRDVEIIMGTLSKSFCSCGGFVAGSANLIDLLRYKAPGFVYSVGLSTPNVAAALAALDLISAAPDYVASLREYCAMFKESANKLGLDTGTCEGFAVCPVVLGDSLKTVWLSNQLLDAGFNVLPIIAPAVPDKRARLRFFLNRNHQPETMQAVLQTTAELLDRASSMSVTDLVGGPS